MVVEAVESTAPVDDPEAIDRLWSLGYIEDDG